MEISKARALAVEALDYRSMRQDLIAGNIANVDTPFYRPKDIRFENVLAQKRAEQEGQNSMQLNMAKTDSKHLDPKQIEKSDKATVFFRDGHMARNDGNSVDIDTETTELSKNGMMYEGLLAALQKDKAIFMSVIDSSGRI